MLSQTSSVWVQVDTQGIDQFEEVFTTVKAALRQPFAALLRSILAHPRTRIIITVRSDFFHYLEDYPELTQWLNQGGGHFLVEPLTPEHYRSLIETPARLAGIEFEPGLVDRLLQDAQQGGSCAGLVPLLEFALLKLYQPFADRQCHGHADSEAPRLFTQAAYDAFGGIAGAIGSAADEAVARVAGSREALPRLFRALVTLDAEHKPTRRRARLVDFDADSICRELVEALIGDQHHARLLVSDRRPDAAHEGPDTGHVEVAHEVLFDAWQTMDDWIEAHKYDLATRDRMLFEAQQWDAGGRQDQHLLWPHERQQTLYAALQRLGVPWSSWTTEPEKSFLQPEAERLRDEIADPATVHERRDWIGARWANIGDPRPEVGLDRTSGLPEILWSAMIEPGNVELEDDGGRVPIEQPFQVAIYPVTRAQYSAFLNAGAEGYEAERWWQGGLQRPDPRWPPAGAGSNYPVGLVTWHEAVAFCRWLDAALRKQGSLPADRQLRLPTEAEWQLAATGGDSQQDYPWPGEWDSARLNSVESGLMRTTAVGLYPAGEAPCGALDMAGNCWEWCLNPYQDPTAFTLDGDAERAVRGGSWVNVQDFCRAASRYYFAPYSRGGSFGFRLCLSSPIVDC